MTARSPTTSSAMRRRPRTISSWCRRSWNNTQPPKQRTSPLMCMLCDDEKAYQAYMNYLDVMERQKAEGKELDPDTAVDAVLDALEAQVNAELKARAESKKTNKFFAEDTTDDKTL